MKTVFLLLGLAGVLSLSGQTASRQRNSRSDTFSHYTLQVRDLPSFLQWAEKQQITVLHLYRPANLVVIRATPAVFGQNMLSNSQVRYAERSSSRPHEELPVPGHNLFVNKINAAHARFPAFDGRGISVSIKEFRFDTTDVDLQNRCLPSPRAAASASIHASIMASLIGGGGNSDPAGAGVAPACSLYSSDFSGLLPDAAADYIQQQVTVQNHAYGVGIENWYGAIALAFDQSVVLRPELLQVFSAGNAGADTAASGIYANLPGFANLTGNFKMAKNVLTVGAVDSFGQVAAYSSRGPAYDGRIKPDLVAFGQNGSSEAAALVSGAAAVLQQAFLEKAGALPTSDLLRAVLLNAADEVLPPGPDFESGFGNLNLNRSIQTLLRQQFILDSVKQGETRVFPLTLPPTSRQLKVTLAWIDPPAQPGALKAMIDDLDLELLDPSGQAWLSWTLNPAPHPDSLRQPARRGCDSLNTVEQVTVELPLPGLWQLRVKGRSMLSGSRPFSIAYAWDSLGRFEWTYPMRDDPAVAGQPVLLRWESQLADTLARLEWRPLGGTWQLIDPAVDLRAGFLPWPLPDTFTEAQVRLLAGGQVFESDTFLIAQQLRMQVGLNCRDSVMLFWNGLPGAFYKVYGLGSRYLEPLFLQQDTFAVLQKSDFPQRRFAVAPLATATGPLGRRSAAPDIGDQGVDCYFKSLFATINQADQVDLTLQLGTDYGLSQVIFEKLSGANFEVLNQQPALSTTFFFTDDNPLRGANFYRARLLLVNGNTLVSDTAAVYFAGEAGIWVFPNPVEPQEELQVVSAFEAAADFLLFDALGRLVLESPLEELRVKIPLRGLPRGFYCWGVRLQGKIRRGGVLMVGK